MQKGDGPPLSTLSTNSASCMRALSACRSPARTQQGTTLAAGPTHITGGSVPHLAPRRRNLPPPGPAAAAPPRCRAEGKQPPLQGPAVWMQQRRTDPTSQAPFLWQTQRWARHAAAARFSDIPAPRISARLSPKAAAASAYSRDRLVPKTPESSVHSATGWPAHTRPGAGRTFGCREGVEGTHHSTRGANSMPMQRVPDILVGRQAAAGERAPRPCSAAKWWSPRMATLLVTRLLERQSSSGTPELQRA